MLRDEDAKTQAAGRSPPAGRQTPSTWVVVGDKPGDNAQVRRVAENLGWRYEEKHIAVKERWAVAKPFVRPSLHHVDLERSDSLEPPWPDFVLTIGRRMSMVALWIKERSGGRTRIAVLGTPRLHLRGFDLVMVASHHTVRPAANVFRYHLPLIRANEEAVKAAAERWRERLADLPHPLTAVLVGGRTLTQRLDPDVARDLARRAAERRDGGSLYVATSRRTPGPVAAALEAALPPGSRMYRWRAGDADNPYHALLGLADRFVVTSDSLSMLLEVAGMAKPLAICELPPSPWSWTRSLFRLRNLSAISRHLVARGHAVRLGEDFREPPGPPRDELPEVVARIRKLVGV